MERGRERVKEFEKIVSFLNGLSKDEVVEIFGGVVQLPRGVEADAYKFKVLTSIPFERLRQLLLKRLVQIGDEVENEKNERGYVAKIFEDRSLGVLMADGDYVVINGNYRKTGKSSMPFANLLKQWQDDEEIRREYELNFQVGKKE